MSQYFFHLKLELYTQPKRPRFAPLSTIKADTTTPFVPPPGSDIFQTSLPSHKRPLWASQASHHTTYSSTSASKACVSSSQRPGKPIDHPPEAHGDALLLPERTLNRKDGPRSPALAPAKPSNDAAAKDWRYDVVSIESIDMQAPALSDGASSKAGVKSGASGLHTKAVYIPSDPKVTEVGWGIVHLYRDNEESHVLDGVATTTITTSAAARKSLEKARREGDGEQFNADECSTLCILAVPSWMMPSDLLGFVGDQAREDVSHFRLIRTGRANKYMALLKFRSPKRAKEWQKAYNGRLFSAAEPENCHVVFIHSVEFVTPDADADALEPGVGGKNFPQNNQHDPFTPARSDSTSLTSKPLAPPPPNLLELPTCPVCLERMDETTGLLTILCQHVFHCACLEKWRFPGSGCPVCRYTQSPSYTFPYPRPSPSSADVEPMCSVCAADANLWICLICGNLGCGRYDAAHAYAHYEETSHCYAMDIATQHVWDYAGDGYVHRLIQSKPDFAASAKTSGLLDDGGVDARKRHANEAYRAESDDVVPREKMESMANEYTYLLTSQLEGQRRYFEEQVERAADKAAQASGRAEAAATAASLAQAQLADAQTAAKDFQTTLERVEKSLLKAEASRAKFESLARQMSTQLREEKTMNEGLLARIHAAEEREGVARQEGEEAKREVLELKDLNHDLTVFISSQEKVKELQAAGEDVEEGSVSLPLEQVQGKGKKGKGKKK